MIPINPTLKLVIALAIVGAVGAAQALTKVEPSWTWLGALIQGLTMLEVFFTIPSGTKAKMAALKAAARVTSVLAMVVGMGCIVGCPSAVPVVGPIGSCVSSIVADALKGMTIAQILAAAGPGCVANAEEVITVLLGSPQAQGTPAYGEAKVARGIR